jgi:uncharacterized Tic20 family protein
MNGFPDKSDLDELPPVRSPVTDDDRLWAMLAHLSILIGLTTIVGPLVIWLMKKDKSAFVDDQAKEALNFQLSCLLASLVTAASCLLAPLALVIIVGGIVYGVIAGIEANKGNTYRYPYTFRMID